MSPVIPILIVLLAVLSVPGSARAASPDALDRAFDSAVRPFINTYCLDCHGSTKPKADFDLSPFTTVASVVADDARWAMVLDQLEAGEMPPKKGRKKRSIMLSEKPKSRR